MTDKLAGRHSEKVFYQECNDTSKYRSRPSIAERANYDSRQIVERIRLLARARAGPGSAFAIRSRSFIHIFATLSTRLFITSLTALLASSRVTKANTTFVLGNTRFTPANKCLVVRTLTIVCFKSRVFMRFDRCRQMRRVGGVLKCKRTMCVCVREIWILS